MKIQPTFNGKIHVTAVKDENWNWYDYKTSQEADEEILKAAKEICPPFYTTARQDLSKQQGENLLAVIEKAVGEKLDIPEDAAYSTTYSEHYNYKEDRPNHSILLFCQEKYDKRHKYTGDRTAIDIYI